MQQLRKSLQELTDWNKEAIHKVLEKLQKSQGIKLGKLAQPVRVAITGGTVSPPIRYYDYVDWVNS